MSRVSGIGGVFFKSENPKQLYEWYEKHLGLKRGPDGHSVMFRWSDAEDHRKQGLTIWALFEQHTRYFDPSRAPFMINYIVEDLDGLLDELLKDGVKIDPKRENSGYGRFAWIMDPEGNRIELWEPPKRS